jgi:hypothetical protein
MKRISLDFSKITSFMLAAAAVASILLALESNVTQAGSGNNLGATCDNSSSNCASSVAQGEIDAAQNPGAGGAGSHKNDCYCVQCSSAATGTFPAGTCTYSSGGSCAQKKGNNTSTNCTSNCTMYAYSPTTGTCGDHTTNGNCDTTGTSIPTTSAVPSC